MEADKVFKLQKYYINRTKNGLSHTQDVELCESEILRHLFHKKKATLL